jgi:hypothetical protein
MGNDHLGDPCIDGKAIKYMLKWIQDVRMWTAIKLLSTVQMN